MKAPQPLNLTANNTQEVLSHWEDLRSGSIYIPIWEGFGVSIYYDNGELGVIGDWSGIPLQAIRVRAYQPEHGNSDPNDRSLDFSVPGLSPYPASGLKVSFRVTKVMRPNDDFYHDKGQVIMSYYFWSKTDVLRCALPLTGNLDSPCWEGINGSEHWHKVGVLRI